MNNLVQSNEISVFDFKSIPVRTTMIDRIPWFIATDIAKALEYSDAAHATRNLDEDEKGLLNSETPGKELSIINESGLYSLILRSRKKEAKAFKKWVTGEVLPALRQHGSYSLEERAATTQEKEIKNFLTNWLPCNYTMLTDLHSGKRAPERLGDFFIPKLRGMRSLNILNKARSLCTSVESPTYSNSGDTTESIK